jgi:hypothetical protein
LKRRIGKIIAEVPLPVLSDIILPKMNGFKFLEKCGNSNEYSKLKVI